MIYLSKIVFVHSYIMHYYAMLVYQRVRIPLYPSNIPLYPNISHSTTIWLHDNNSTKNKTI